MSSYLLSWSVVIYEYKMMEKDTLITKHQIQIHELHLNR